MLNHDDYLEATKRFKDKNRNAHERLRCHALLLLSKGYSYSQTADILFIDEDTVRQWLRRYEEKGLDGLKNNPLWGGSMASVCSSSKTRPNSVRCSTQKRSRARRWAVAGP
jgi:transposase-like protein